jgi:hypothetical protein
MNVIQNAYLKIARENKNYSQVHERLLLALINTNKYHSKEELLCFTKYNPVMLDNILEDLYKTGVISVEGWLVKITQKEKLNEIICEELIIQQ